MDVYFKDPLNGFVVGMDPHNFLPSCCLPYYGRLARDYRRWRNMDADADDNYFVRPLWKMSWPTPQIGYVSIQQNGAYSDIVYYKTTRWRQTIGS